MWLIINAYGDLVVSFKEREQAVEYCNEIDPSDMKGYQIKYQEISNKKGLWKQAPPYLIKILKKYLTNNKKYGII